MATMAESIAEKVGKKEVNLTPVKAVQLEGQALLKIVQHCNDSLPQLVTGQLLGLDVGNTLEVTDCFPFPASAGDGEGDDDAAGASYQLDMMRCLREVNVDNNTVGWYQSANLGTYQTIELIETFIAYYENIRRCVCLLYDPLKSTRGSLVMKAVRVKDTFVEMFKEGKLSVKDMHAANLSWKDVFVEVPIKLHNSALVEALLASIQPESTASQSDFDRLALSTAPFLEKNISGLIEGIDDLFNEQGKVSLYHKNLARQQQQMAAWLQKRKQENSARRSAGEEPLPEEDPIMFKPVPEPSQLDFFLVASQMSTYCDHLNVATYQGLQKLNLMEAMQKSRN